MAAVAELEAGLISQRTRAVLGIGEGEGCGARHPRLRAGRPDQARKVAAVKRRISCARAADVLPYGEAARRAGAKTLRELTAPLTARGVPAPAGGRAWRPMHSKRVVDATRS